MKQTHSEAMLSWNTYYWTNPAMEQTHDEKIPVWGKNRRRNSDNEPALLKKSLHISWDSRIRNANRLNVLPDKNMLFPVSQAAIRTQPRDLLLWSAAYFRSTHLSIEIFAYILRPNRVHPPNFPVAFNAKNIDRSEKEIRHVVRHRKTPNKRSLSGIHSEEMIKVK
jgi:hypothetical protein